MPNPIFERLEQWVERSRDIGDLIKVFAPQKRENSQVKVDVILGISHPQKNYSSLSRETQKRWTKKRATIF